MRPRSVVHAKLHISLTVSSIKTHSPSSIELNREGINLGIISPLLQSGAFSATHPSSQATPCCRGRRAYGRGTNAVSSNFNQRKNTEGAASCLLASTNPGLGDVSTTSITSLWRLRSRVTARQSVTRRGTTGEGRGHHLLWISAKFRKECTY